jgi:hypothetical protein
MAAKKRKSPGPIHSRKQQAYIFGVLAKKDPKAKVWGKRWAREVGEVGPHGKPSAASKAAYKRLPERKGARKR